MSERLERLMMSVALGCTSWAASHVDPASINAWEIAPTLFVIQVWISGISAIVQIISMLAAAPKVGE